MTISQPTSSLRSTDIASGDILTFAVGLSPTLIASAPASCSSRAPATARRALSPCGGSTSTDITKRPASTFSRKVWGSPAVFAFTGATRAGAEEADANSYDSEVTVRTSVAEGATGGQLVGPHPAD